MTARFSAKAELAIDVACQILTLVIICLRLYVAIYLSGRLKAPDVFVALAWVFFLANTITDFLSDQMGMWDPRIAYTTEGLPPYDMVIKDKAKLKKAFILMYATASAYYLSLYFVKMTFLCLYRKIFPVDFKKLRLVVNGTIGLITVGYAVLVGMMFFWCLPISRNWTMDPKDRCLTWAAVTPYFFGTGFHIITDIFIYALPFFILPRLYHSCSRRKFLGIILMFSLGLLCILSSVARIVNAGLNSSAEVIAVWCTVEITSSIIVACILPIKRLWDISHRKSGGDGRGRRRSRSRSWTRSRSWSKSMAWARWRWNRTDDIEKSTATRTWISGDVDTLETLGRDHTTIRTDAGNGGLAPRRDSKQEGVFAPARGVMSVVAVDAETAGTLRKTKSNESDNSASKKQGYFARLLRRGDRTTTTTNRTIALEGTSRFNEKQKPSATKKKKKEEIGNLTFGPATSPGLSPARSPSDPDAIYPMITPTRSPGLMLSPRGSTFGQLSVSTNSRENLDLRGSSLSVNRQDFVGQEEEARASVGSLTFGPKASVPSVP